MTGRVHALMENPSDTEYVFSHLIKHKMLFNPVATAARKSVVARLAPVLVFLQQHKAALQSLCIGIHLRCSPRLQRVLQDIFEILSGELGKLDAGLSL